MRAGLLEMVFSAIYSSGKQPTDVIILFSWRGKGGYSVHVCVHVQMLGLEYKYARMCVCVQERERQRKLRDRVKKEK